MKKEEIKKNLDSHDYIKICDGLDLLGLYKVKGFYRRCKDLLLHRNHIVRMYALSALVEVSCRDETKLLMQFTQDKSSSVRVTAYTLLFYLLKKDIYLNGIKSVLDEDDDYHLLYVVISYCDLYNQRNESKKVINLIKKYSARFTGGFKKDFEKLITGYAPAT